MNAVINLEQVAPAGKVRNLSGKERGVAARLALSLDSIEDTEVEIEIIVPDFIDTISPSYFQGLFSESIRKFGGKAGFLEKYKFTAPSDIFAWIDLGIRNSTSSRDPLI